MKIINNQKYWNDFYKKKESSKIPTPSSFAFFCKDNFISDSDVIVDIGCGDGRDSIFFAENGHKTYSIDLSDEAIKLSKNYIKQEYKNNIFLINDDFVEYNYNLISDINIIYSRFTMHTITLEKEYKILENIFHNTNSETLFLIEARTINDPLFKRSVKISEYEGITDHYRRFIDTDKFVKTCKEIGFEILYFVESNNLSIYKDDNPTLMRIILKKKNSK